MMPTKHAAQHARHTSTAAILLISAEEKGWVKHTVAISGCILLNCIQNQLKKLQNGNDQGAKCNWTKRKCRCTSEGGESRILWLFIILRICRKLTSYSTCHFTKFTRPKVVPWPIRSACKRRKGDITNDLRSPQERKGFEENETSNLAAGAARSSTGYNKSDTVITIICYSLKEAYKGFLESI